MRRVNRIGAALRDVLQRLDDVLRSWAVAGLALLILALVLAGAMLLNA
jgi:hypothetical protein